MKVANNWLDTRSGLLSVVWQYREVDINLCSYQYLLVKSRPGNYGIVPENVARQWHVFCGSLCSRKLCT